MFFPASKFLNSLPSPLLLHIFMTAHNSTPSSESLPPPARGSSLPPRKIASTRPLVIGMIRACMFVLLAPFQCLYAIVFSESLTHTNTPRRHARAAAQHAQAEVQHMAQDKYRNDEKVVMPFRSTSWATVSKYCEEVRKQRKEAQALAEESAYHMHAWRRGSMASAHSQERTDVWWWRRRSDASSSEASHPLKTSSGSRFYAKHLKSDSFEDSDLHYHGMHA